MPVVVVQPSLDEPTAKFIAISNVLGGIRAFDRVNILGKDMHKKAATHVIAARSVPKSPRTLSKDSKRHLRIAWQTELAARVSDQFDDEMLRRVAAQTLPVQAYYAVFNAGRASTRTRGTACNTHSALQREFATQRVKSGYKSWGVTLAGDPVDVAAAVLAPPITTPSAFNLMELSHDPEDYVFAALRMTRRWRLEGARTDWLRGKKTKAGTPRKTLPAAERTSLISALRPTTVLDFMYELRVRTNYDGVEEYGSDADDSTVEQFHRGLLHLTDMGLLHYERDLAQAIGLSRYEDEVNEWIQSVAKVGGWAADRVLRRLGHIRTALNP